MAENEGLKLPSSLTVALAAESTGLSEKAIRRRIERGKLRKLKQRDGTVKVPRIDLEAQGLLPPSGALLGGVGEMGELEPAALLDKLLQQAERIGRLEALPEQVDSTRRELAAEREAHEATRAEVFKLRAELEAAHAEDRAAHRARQKKRGWFRR